MTEFANDKRYHTLDHYYKTRFGTKVVKVSLNCSFTCPNRDGTKGVGGCIYCSPMASGDFAGSSDKTIAEQFYDVTKVLSVKWKDTKYIPYFQAGTNTYASLPILKNLYEEALSLPDVVGLSIATRPDCITDDVLEYLTELNERTFLTIELGLQTIHDKTAERINRKSTYAEFLDCYQRLTERNIAVCVHLINNLPGETRDMMLESVEAVVSLRPGFIKLHQLHILKGTAAAKLYRDGEITLSTKEEAISLLCDQLELLPPETVIARLTGDGDARNLIAPLWTVRKREVLNGIDQEMKRRDAFQGDKIVQSKIGNG